MEYEVKYTATASIIRFTIRLYCCFVVVISQAKQRTSGVHIKC